MLPSSSFLGHGASPVGDAYGTFDGSTVDPEKGPSDHDGEKLASGTAAPTCTRARCGICTCTCCFVFFVFLNLLAFFGVAKPFLNPDHELSEKENKLDMPTTALSSASLHRRESACDAILSAFEETGKSAENFLVGFKKVHFKSRADPDGRVEQLELVGHYLPVLPAVGLAADSPTIVVVHGHACDSLHHTVLTAAYYLRIAGFNVLLPNLRNHGQSPDSKSKRLTWGQEERLDILGAWDFAVEDPVAALGHKTAAAKVGLMGFSMGGYISKMAFGEEPRIPALLVDGAVHDTRVLLNFLVAKTIGMSFPVANLAWMYVKLLVGMGLTPDTELPLHPESRRIGNIHATDDEKVPWEQSDLFEASLARLGQPPGGFSPVRKWHPETIVCGAGEAKCMENKQKCPVHTRLQLIRQGEYCLFLYDFFSEALGFVGVRAACQLTYKQEQDSAVLLGMNAPPRLTF